jgi:hypothetical protein
MCQKAGTDAQGAYGGPGAILGPGGRSWSHGACGGPGAAMCQEMGAAGHVAMCARLVFRFDLEIVRGVSGLQGTDRYSSP